MAPKKSDTRYRPDSGISQGIIGLAGITFVQSDSIAAHRQDPHQISPAPHIHAPESSRA